MVIRILSGKASVFPGYVNVVYRLLSVQNGDQKRTTKRKYALIQGVSLQSIQEYHKMRTTDIQKTL